VDPLDTEVRLAGSQHETELSRRELVGNDPRFADMASIGGLYVAAPDTDPALVRDAVLSGSTRGPGSSTSIVCRSWSGWA
jgi:hypothetical protein